MKFKDIAIKNFKAHMEKYLSYFLSSSFAIAMFFIYSTLFFNKEIREGTGRNFVVFLFGSALVGILVFSVIFINYVHTALIKTRSKEFALYLTLGMGKKEVNRLVAIEDTFIILASIITGLGTGLVFSRLFHMVIISMLDLKGIKYSISYMSFVLTLTVFLSIFAAVIGFSRHAVGKLEITQLFKSSKQSEMPKKQRLIPGILGIVLFIASLVMIYVCSVIASLKINPLIVLGFSVLCFWGVYLIISNFGSLLLRLVRKKNTSYYKNILLFSEISHKFKQNRKVFFILCILSSMIIFFVASSYSLFSESKNIAVLQTNNLEFAENSGINKLPENNLNSILNSGDTSIKLEKNIEYIELDYTGKSSNYDRFQIKPVISNTTYNENIDGKKLNLQNGEAVNLITAWEPGYHGISPGSTVELSNEGKAYKFKVKASGHEDQLHWKISGETYPSSSWIVISDDDYKSLKNAIIPQNLGTVHVISFENWQKSEGIINNLKSALAEQNKNILKNADRVKYYNVVSTYETYKTLKQGYAVMLFVMGLMGLLFFISSVSVLFFKQYTEINEAREKYRKLYKLGIKEKEVRKVIARELGLTFFVPMLFGTAIGYAFMFYMTHLVGGQIIIKPFMKNSTVIAALYFVFHAVFYTITKRKYSGKILGSFTGGIQ